MSLRGGGGWKAGSGSQVSFPDVLNEIKARVNYRKNLPKGTENTIEEGSMASKRGGEKVDTTHGGILYQREKKSN